MTRPDTAAYRNLASQHRSAVTRGVALNLDDKRIANVIERILCDFEAYVDADLHIAACPRLAPYIHAGLAHMRGNNLSVTALGRPYVRNIAACFDPAFKSSPARHSLAI